MLNYWPLPYMLGNMASDLDNLLTDLHGKKTAGHSHQAACSIRDSKGEQDLHTLSTPGTLHSADTLGKDSFLSSAGNTGRRHGDALSSSASLLSAGGDVGCGGNGGRDGSDVDISNIASDGGLHSRHGDPTPEEDVESSVDSGHGGTGKSRSAGRDGISRRGAEMTEHSETSALVFDPQHFSRHSPSLPGSGSRTNRPGGPRVVIDDSPSTDELRPISTVERLVKTNSIWLLASLSRAGAVHILKDRDTGNFVVRKSSQPQSLALSVQSRLCGHPAVDHYLIQGTSEGFRLEGSAHLFHSIPTLISYYIENIDEIPYHLRLPVAIQQARSTRELASLDMLGQDFWSSALSRKSSLAHSSFAGGQLHKSQSEPINIQKQPAPSHASSQHELVNNTPPSRSTEGFSHFMSNQVEMERYFSQRIQDVNLNADTPPSKSNQDKVVGSSDIVDSPAVHVTTAVVVSLPGNSSDGAGLTRTTPIRALPSPPNQLLELSHPMFPPASNHPSLDLTNSSVNLEPIYSVSKKQRKKASRLSASKEEPDLVDIQSIPTIPAGVTSSVSSPSSSHEQPVLEGKLSISEPNSVPTVHLTVEDEDPYRRSPSNKLAGTGITQGDNPRVLTPPRTGDGGSHFTPRPKANLYFTTNLDLLEIPDSTYFTSHLSDRLSDYEDIWRSSSCAESELEPRLHCNKQHLHHLRQQQQQHSAARMFVDPRAALDARISQNQQRNASTQSKDSDRQPIQGMSEKVTASPTKEGKRKVLRKTSRDWPAARRVPAARDAVTGGSTGLTALEQARKIAGSTSDEESVASPTPLYHHNHPPPVAHVKGIRRLSSVFNYEDEEGRPGGRIDEMSTPAMTTTASAITTTTTQTVAVSKTAVVTNTNSIHILPSRPNQITFVTSHSLDLSPTSQSAVFAQQHSSPALTSLAAATSLSSTPTSSKSLPARVSREVQSCLFTTTMAVHVSEASGQPAPPVTSRAKPETGVKSDTPSRRRWASKRKEKPHLWSPLSRLTRLKSSSESSLATVSSPLYAEPADAVKLRDKHGKAVNIQIKRQSAPSGPQQLLVTARDKQQQQQQSSHRVSLNPNLDTIFSPTLVSNESLTPPGKSNLFTFEDVPQLSSSASSTASVAGTSSKPSVARSHSMRTPYEQSQLQRKQSWRDRLNRLKLGTRVLTRNLTPPSAPSVRLHQQHPKAEANCSADFSGTSDQRAMQPATQVPPSPSSPGKFPILCNQFFHHRDSCFSESSTVQDLISCAHPELSVQPIMAGVKSHLQAKAGDLARPAVTRTASAPPSEYDNLGTYKAPTQSSADPVYLPPWETSAASRLMKQELALPEWPSSHHPWPTSSQPPPLPSQPPLQQLSSSTSHGPQLPPAMDIKERIARWQDFNTTYLQHHQVSPPKSSRTVTPSSTSVVKNAFAPRVAPFSPEPGLGVDCKGRNSSRGPQVGKQGQQQPQHSIQQQVKPQESHLQQQQQQLLHHQRQVKNNTNEHHGDVQGQGQISKSPMRQQQQQQQQQHLHLQYLQQQKHPYTSQQHPANSDPCQPLPPLHPVSPISANVASSVPLPTAVSMQNSAPRTSSPAPFSASATPPSPHRLSSHCPDVVHCHSTPVPPALPPSTLQMYEGMAYADLTTPHMIGEDDVLFGGSLAMVSPELQRQISPVLSPQSCVSPTDKAPGTRIREYIFKLSSDHQTTFGSTIENFIQCTLESQEANPQHVMRNVRQFMTGIKNYLVKHGEGMLEDLIERERNKLTVNEILNIDAIIEQALHVCVLKPLKYHIYRLFVDKYSGNHSLEQLSRNIKYARTKTAEDLGVKSGLNVPGSNDMEVIKYYLDLMQRSYSPLQKLQNLLKATSTIYHCVQGKHHQFPSRGPASLGADDFLPMLIYVLVHCGLVAAEIEADFMWGLLQPSLLTGEGGYYLTTLSSAVLVLKNFQETHDVAPVHDECHLPTLADMQGFLKIAILDELHDSINWKTLPVRPNMNTRDVCTLIAHKFKVTNPQDYGLFLLCEGHESQIADVDCPQIIKGDYLAAKKTCFFAFKRLDANIAWPKHMQESTLIAADLT